MGGPLIDKHRTKLWWVLSDAFVDNKVDYAAMVRQLRGFDPRFVREVLFSEVAPVCHYNLESVLPGVWLCFNREELEANIEKMLRAREVSRLKRWYDNVRVLWLRYRYRYVWSEISKAMASGNV
jgi:hypothetical protein